VTAEGPLPRDRIEASHLHEDPEDDVRWDVVRPRSVSSEQWERFQAYVAEIFRPFGMDLETPGTNRTPGRVLRALLDSTAGYGGDPKLLTTFPTECRGGPDCRISQIIEGPISFFSLCEHHALPFHGVAHIGYVAHSIRALRDGRGRTRPSSHRSVPSVPPSADLRMDLSSWLRPRRDIEATTSAG
jgi:hypothetical protein